MKFRFAHNNFNVLDLEKSVRFYQEALSSRRSGGRRPPTAASSSSSSATAKPAINWS